MALKKPDDFRAAGSKVFVQKPADKDAIRNWVDIAQKKIGDADNVAVSNGTRLHAAYDAVMVLSQAVLSANGWKMTGEPGHHQQTLEAACALTGASQPTFDAVDAIREMRNGQYDAREPTSGDVDFARKTLERLVPSLLAHVAPLLKR